MAKRVRVCKLSDKRGHVIVVSRVGGPLSKHSLILGGVDARLVAAPPLLLLDFEDSHALLASNFLQTIVLGRRHGLAELEQSALRRSSPRDVDVLRRPAHGEEARGFAACVEVVHVPAEADAPARF